MPAGRSPSQEPGYPDLGTNGFFDGIDEGMPRMLDLFDKHDIKVTWFTIGETIEKHSELAREIVRRGSTRRKRPFWRPFATAGGVISEIAKVIGSRPRATRTGLVGLVERGSRGGHDPKRRCGDFTVELGTVAGALQRTALLRLG